MRFVWAHNCGHSKAAVIRGMLARYLYCNLANMTNVGATGYGTGWPRMEEFSALIEQDGVLGFATSSRNSNRKPPRSSPKRMRFVSSGSAALLHPERRR